MIFGFGLLKSFPTDNSVGEIGSYVVYERIINGENDSKFNGDLMSQRVKLV